MFAQINSTNRTTFTTTTPSISTITTSTNNYSNQSNQNQIKEQVKCVFENSQKEETCYTTITELNIHGNIYREFSCSGIGACVVNLEEKKGEKLTWKSSCGGYAYTVIDGEDELAKFNCLSDGKIPIKAISGKGFKYAYWQCYNGESQQEGSEYSCKSSETWQSYAKEFCQDKCSNKYNKDKCGVNSLSVAEECYLDFEKYGVSFIPYKEQEKEDKKYKKYIKEEEILVCKDSCPLNGKCYPLGFRKAGSFCSDIGSFVEQLKDESPCDNNFECSSNICASGTCVSEGLVKKILGWFKNLFR